MRIARLVGPARAKELLLLRERVAAHEAHRLGLVTEVVPSGGALARALEMAAQLASLPPLAVETALRLADALPGASRDAGLLLERLAYAALGGTRDAQEAAEAFTEKREPRFEGR
jgi:enoyl-CoA hydratase/carnithine racemase